MPDFGSLLKKPAGESKRPPVLPADDYQGIISGSYETGESRTNHNPFVRFPIRLTEWGPSVPDTWEVWDAASNTNYSVSKADVDLSKRQMRRDFYLTDDALWRLDEFIKSCGIEPEGRSYSEILPELIGKTVTVEVQQYVNTNTNEVGNQIGRLVGTGG